MKSLTQEQKEMLVDFYFKSGSVETIQKACELIAVNHDAAEYYDKIEQNLGVVDQCIEEECPDYLLEQTISKFNQIVSTKTTLDRLIEKYGRQNHKLSDNPWSAIGRIAAVAAMLAIVAAVYLPATSQMRQISRKFSCKNNLRQIAGGISGYSMDNSGQMPQVNRLAGGPWWRVGSQDNQNQSNTRNLWLLVKGDYAKLEDFMCPGRPNIVRVELKDIDITKFERDFPGSEFVDYSFQLMTNQCERTDTAGSVIAADANPLFEKCRKGDIDCFERFRLTGKMLDMASVNHAKKGQNVLFKDGSVRFSGSRTFSNDDIYTVRGEMEYTGSESPSCVNDVFLVP